MGGTSTTVLVAIAVVAVVLICGGIFVLFSLAKSGGTRVAHGREVGVAPAPNQHDDRAGGRVHAGGGVARRRGARAGNIRDEHRNEDDDDDRRVEVEGEGNEDGDDHDEVRPVVARKAVPRELRRAVGAERNKAAQQAADEARREEGKELSDDEGIASVTVSHDQRDGYTEWRDEMVVEEVGENRDPDDSMVLNELATAITVGASTSAVLSLGYHDAMLHELLTSLLSPTLSVYYRRAKL